MTKKIVPSRTKKFRRLVEAEDQQDDHARADRAEGAGRSPAPRLALDHTEHDGEQTHGEQGDAGYVELLPRGGGVLALRQDERAVDEGDQATGRRPAPRWCVSGAPT
ncbi:hypothetical protein QF037_008037 [Streptomyces canus]|nr:hypothetical protein [Streptomyces canus]